MIGIKREIVAKIYSDQRFVNYIRYNPRWYKILYYYPERVDDFFSEAKEAMKIRFSDQIEQLKGQISFLSSLIEYINK